MPKTTSTVGDSSEPPQPPTGEEQPPATEILAHLESILKSGTFSGAARQQRLLRHLVEKRLRGEAGELKEYTLGVEVFDRGEDFDSRLDPIVRVEASRLRSRLQKYYDGAGLEDRIRITLPRGAYVPSFEDLDRRPAPPLPVEALPTIDSSTVLPTTVLKSPVLPVGAAALKRPGRFGRLWPLGAALAVSMAAGLAIWQMRNPARESTVPDFVHFQRITSDEAQCTSPSFSPDAKFLVYARRSAGKWDLFQRNVSNLASTELTAGSTADNVQPAWSPNGKTIAFRSEREGGGIFLLDARTGTVTRLTTAGYHPAWSPDSTKIAFSMGTFDDPAETSTSQTSALSIVDVKTKAVQRVGFPEPLYDALQPAWSPDGSRIAFWGTDRDGDRDIWTISAKSTTSKPINPVRVTHDTWTDWSAAWAPDGSFLYFSSDRGGAMNLWRIRIDQRSGQVRGEPEPVTTPSPYSGFTSFAGNGKEFAYVHRLVSSQLYKAPFDVDKGVQLDQKVQLTGGERSLREPEMSPDGAWIVVRVQDPQEDLALIRPDGSDLHRLTNDTFSDRNPHWSPDGKQILFVSNRSGRFEVWSIRQDGSGMRQITKGGPMSYSWTPDGTLVGYPAEGNPVSLEPPGQKITDLGLPPVFRPMAWSPTGESVVGRMRSNAFSRGALFIYTPASADYWQIAPAAFYPSTVWLKDGMTLLFSQAGGLFLADLRTHQVRPAAPRSPSEMHSRFTISRDGGSLFFVLSDDEEDVWVGRQ